MATKRIKISWKLMSRKGHTGGFFPLKKYTQQQLRNLRKNGYGHRGKRLGKK